MAQRQSTVQPPGRNLVHRPTVGILAVVLLAAGAAASLFAPSTVLYEQIASAGLRIGAVLGVIWLALPDLRLARNRWLLGTLLACCIAVFLLPRIPIVKLLPILGIAWLALSIIRPRRRTEPGNHRSR
ncbi:MAG TPA: hypothetical protein VG713_16135 [Pirellulales bacterium]|nr:hypothetical protein [Pirellulales bacterium]